MACLKEECENGTIVLKKLSQYLFYLLIAFILIKRIPGIIDNFAIEGQVQVSTEREVINRNDKVTYPPPGPAVTLFWATWCAPCKLEMERLKHSVESGKLPRERVFMISMGESAETIKSFLRTKDYPFTFLTPSSADAILPVKATPTLVLWQDGRVISMGTGFSIWAIWRAESMF